MIVSTVILGINIYGGDFSEDKVPVNRTAVSELKPAHIIEGKWDGSQWIEGMTVAEINAKNAPIYEKEIVDIYSMLCERALRSSMGKGYEYDTYQKLKQQQEEYAEMYAVSVGLSVKQTVIDGIQDEIDMDFPLAVLEAELISYGITPTGTHLEKMYQLIKFKYEYGEVIYNIYIRYAVSFRKKSRSWVASNLWGKLDSGFNIARSIPLELSISEAEIIFNQFENL